MEERGMGVSEIKTAGNNGVCVQKNSEMVVFVFRKIRNEGVCVQETRNENLYV
jgi:hypothetical protein